MNNSDQNLSRLNRKKRRKGDKILNALIAVVVLAIIITASIIFMGGGKEQANEDNKADNKEQVEQSEADNSAEDESAANEENLSLPVEDAKESEGDAEEDLAEEDAGDVEITVDPNNELVSQSITDPAWEPIGTEQTGEHVSLYDGKSVDWQEKEKALSYATGLSHDNMIIWKIKNGGSPQKSIGIVSSMDKTEMYQVYLEWVDQQGWKPVKMDVLTTLNFNY